MTRALAIDIGGTHIRCRLVAQKHLLAFEEALAQGPERLGDLLPAISAALKALLQCCDVRASECAGIGIGFPEIMDARDSSIHSTLRKYEDAPGLDFRGWAHSTFGLPVRIENDAWMVLIDERFACAAAGSQNVVIMTPGDEPALLGALPLVTEEIHGSAV